MIAWLVQSCAAHPDLARGVPPPGLLTDEEAARCAAFKVEKRRREWLLGRWTAKRLIRAVLARERGEQIELRAFTIANDADGAPLVSFGIPAGHHGLPGFTLSISHSGDYGLCAVCETTPGSERATGLGADIERIEPRADSFAADYFTPEECALLARAPAAGRDRLVTAIWSGKEAALKALRLGLSVDTRAVSCHVAPGGPASNWKRFEICCNIPALPDVPPLRGWWRSAGAFVLTIVATEHAGEPSEFEESAR